MEINCPTGLNRQQQFLQLRGLIWPSTSANNISFSECKLRILRRWWNCQHRWFHRVLRCPGLRLLQGAKVAFLLGLAQRHISDPFVQPVGNTTLPPALWYARSRNSSPPGLHKNNNMRRFWTVQFKKWYKMYAWSTVMDPHFSPHLPLPIFPRILLAAPRVCCVPGPFDAPGLTDTFGYQPGGQAIIYPMCSCLYFLLDQMTITFLNLRFLCHLVIPTTWTGHTIWSEAHHLLLQHLILFQEVPGVLLHLSQIHTWRSQNYSFGSMEWETWQR